jgi:hypothetical protein
MNTPSYDELLEQINRLPDDEYNKLLATLLALRKTDKLITKNDLRELLLKAPTWSDEQWEAFQEARNHINQSRLA